MSQLTLETNFTLQRPADKIRAKYDDVQRPVSRKYSCPNGQQQIHGEQHRQNEKRALRQQAGSSGRLVLPRTSSNLRHDSASFPYSSTAVRSASEPIPLTRSLNSRNHIYCSSRINTNATFSLLQRSGAPLVKEIISSLKAKTKAAGGIQPSATTPESECSTLANCARDPYYRVVIAASGGVPAIVRAMEAFRDDESTQASGCAAVASLCENSAGNQSIALREGGTSSVLEAMRLHPLSIAVQSSACDALLHLTSRCPDSVDELRMIEDFQFLMHHALVRFMPPSCRESAKVVLKRVSRLPC